MDLYSELSLFILQDRGRKLCSGWRGPLEMVDPDRINIKGSVVGKNLAEARINRFLIERYFLFKIN